MTDKQRKFAEEYVIDCNATQAAIRAGYNEKTAYSQGQRMLKNVEVKKHIDELLEKISSAKTADAQEVMEYLTSVLRGESQSTVCVTVGTGDGCSEAQLISKPPDEKERLKAAELLGKRYGLYIDKSDISGAVPTVISGEDQLEE